MTSTEVSTATAPTGNALVAAAYRITDAPKLTRKSKSTTGWQARAWEFYDTVGEFRYAADWVGSMLSKAKLEVRNDEDAVVSDGLPAEVLDALYGGPENQSRMLAAFGTHLTVAGEYYVVGATRKGQDVWVTAAPGEVSSRGGKVYVDSKAIESDTDVYISRNWRPHPRRHTEAIAPSKAVLPILSEIDGLTRHVAAQIDSRLAGAGILILPNELKFPTAPVTGEDGTTQQVASGELDEFVKMLTEAMSAAIADREEASALVPITLTVPGEYVDKVNLLHFWTELDAHAIELRTEAIRRLGLGLDMPPEVLTGTGDLNHWNAWAVDDAAIKVHAEPALDLVCTNLTDGYLRPLLVDLGMGQEEANTYYVHADTSGIRLRPNRSSEALDLYDRGLLSADALRRETGFDKEDAPDQTQVVEWLLRKIAGGSTDPQMVASALAQLGVKGITAEVGQLTQAQPAPSIADTRGDEPQIPDTLPDAQQDTSTVAAASAACRADLLAACEQMVYRALERAGNRIKTRLNGNRPQGVAAAELYLFVPAEVTDTDDLLIDAWSQVDRFCPQLGCADPDQLVSVLDGYTRMLLAGRQAYDRQLLAQHLALIDKPEPARC
jgi:hypothetical protein